MGRVDLIWLGNSAPPPLWPIGAVTLSEATPSALANRLREVLGGCEAEGCLFWDSALEAPDPRRVQEALARPADLWHAGLRLGMTGLPGLLDFVAPTWMLNRDPAPTIEATSWRLSLRACLVRTEVLRRLGGSRPEFLTLEGAALELGHRYLMRGALMRYVPWLLGEGMPAGACSLPFDDELRFIYYRFGRLWSRWSAARALLTGYAHPARILGAWKNLRRAERPPESEALRPRPFDLVRARGEARISVVLPTLDRYTYLRTLLGQLRNQTIMPTEILVMDQTSLGRRDPTLAASFQDLPLKHVFLDHAGQCSSRNLGLVSARGDFILFLDDDDEVPPDLIAKHLDTLHTFRADVSSGVADEKGAGPVPEAFRLLRASDVFPTNNTLIRRRVLDGSGLFDLAYERGQRADGDLGMRVYLSGAFMVLNPQISVLHHHAPEGGLRTHKARVITYASSRARLAHRHLPSATEIYLAKRYFAPRQTREMLWLGCLGTFSIRGSALRKLVKALVAVVLLPLSL
ncbi:MAG: glycosyltransferase family 2 protein, partial [Candidatus Methylomirabilis sp.]